MSFGPCFARSSSCPCARASLFRCAYASHEVLKTWLPSVAVEAAVSLLDPFQHHLRKFLERWNQIRAHLLEAFKSLPGAVDGLAQIVVRTSPAF